MTRQPLHPRRSDEPFVGYAPTPGVDRRFLFAFAGVTIALTSGMGWLIARTQTSAGGGGWDMGRSVGLVGTVHVEPYAHIRVLENGGVRTVILGCETKCGAGRRLQDIGFAGGLATVRGSLIERDGYRMLAVPEDPDWITPLEGAADAAFPPEPVEEDLGEARLTGEILDSKCWFGAMRPNEGLGHKACAMLCIANGIPPYFGVTDPQGRERALMITDPHGAALVQPILRFVAEPVEAVGRLVRRDDLIQFRMDPETIRRRV